MKDGKCIASNRTLMKYCGVKSERSIQAGLARLEEEDCVIRIFKNGSKTKRAEIKCLYDPEDEREQRIVPGAIV